MVASNGVELHKRALTWNVPLVLVVVASSGLEWWLAPTICTLFDNTVPQRALMQRPHQIAAINKGYRERAPALKGAIIHMVERLLHVQLHHRNLFLPFSGMLCRFQQQKQTSIRVRLRHKYRNGGSDLSHTQPRILRIAHKPAIGLNLARLVAPTTFGAFTVKEHIHSSRKFMSQHISDSNLASFPIQSGGNSFKTSAVIWSGVPSRISVCSVHSSIF